MDIGALLPNVSGALNSPVAAFAPSASIPADSRALLSEIATSSGLSDVERTAMVQAVAAVDAGQVSGSVRQEVMAQISGLGFFLKHTGDQGLPRWSVMTSLRTYGLNIEGYGAPSQTEKAVAQHVRGQLAQIAQGRGVSLESALAAVRQQQPAPAVIQQARVVAEPVVTYSNRGETKATPAADGGRVEKVA